MTVSGFTITSAVRPPLNECDSPPKFNALNQYDVVNMLSRDISVWVPRTIARRNPVAVGHAAGDCRCEIESDDGRRK